MTGFGQSAFGTSSFGGGEDTLDEVLSESVTVSEDLIVEKGFSRGFGRAAYGRSLWGGGSPNFSVELVEQVTVSDSLLTDAFQIEVLDGYTILVTFPIDSELHFNGTTDTDHYILTQNPDNPGVPLAILRAEPVYDIEQTGTFGKVVPERTTNEVLLTSGQTSNFEIDGTIDGSTLNDFIEIENSSNVGLYQILSVVGPEVAELDRPLSLVDRLNGNVTLEGLNQSEDLNIELVSLYLFQDVNTPGGATYDYTFQVNDPRVTALTPIEKVYRVERTARPPSSAGVVINPLDPTPPDPEATVQPAFQFWMNETYITYNDYRTFTIRQGASLNVPGSDVLAFIRSTDTVPPVIEGTSVTVGSTIDTFRGLVQIAGAVSWAQFSGVKAVRLTTSKMTRGAGYYLQVVNLLTKDRQPYTSDVTPFQALNVEKPKLVSVTAQDDGIIDLLFDQAMQADSANLHNPEDYALSGPNGATVRKVIAKGDNGVSLVTQGMTEGDYTLTVSTNTPKDLAGNPLDPTFNSAIFTSAIPLTSRSIFTDKGPIKKAILTLQSGTGATLDTFDRVSLPGAALTLSDIGQRVTLSSSALNDGSYKIVSIIDTNTAKVQASFALPDANNGAIDWAIRDPRIGQIADDPSDVVVRINGLPTTVDAVIGLRGQIVLPDPPAPTDTVEVDYAWCCNPRVEVRRLNSKEFRLNAWNRDRGGIQEDTNNNRHYRYNNVLVIPSDYDPDDTAAPLESPLFRNIKYRAYERAYTAVLNDPNLLVLNTPIHKIAFPGSSRTLSESSVFYEALTLPENDPQHPWVRVGTSPASVSAGVLTVNDISTGTFPMGEGLFWKQSLDLTFNHVFAAAWRFSLDTVAITEGVWTGIAAGYSNELLAYVVGYIDDGGVKKIGFLKRGAQDAIGDVTSWVGGIAPGNIPTNAPVAFDWSILHSYRIFTDQQGVVRLFVNGDIVETLRITPDEAPFLEEMNAPFDEIQGAFFGSLSRPAESASSWDFYRYLIQPINALQVAPSSFVSYEANDVPELDPSPWTPVGFHGTSTILTGDFLLLDSTSATDASTSALAGLVGGDFHGYFKIEPLLTAASQFSVDINVQLLTHTHGPDPDGLMLAVDDSHRLMQLCFFPDQAAPKFSYGGRSFPEDFSPYTWTPLGSQSVEMVGRYLRINEFTPLTSLTGNVSGLVLTDGSQDFVASEIAIGDTLVVLTGVSAGIYSITAVGVATISVSPAFPAVELGLSYKITKGKVYSLQDTSPAASATRVISGTTDYIVESRLKVDDYTVDANGFAGAFSQAYDSTRSVGILLQENAGTRYVAFHSDGVTLGPAARFAFEWNDGEFHSYRFRKSTGGDLVSLFVDGVFLGSYAYSSFVAPPPDPIGDLSFGSATIASSQAVSTVQWAYCNAWRISTDTDPLTLPRNYVGLWKGTSLGDLRDYHLPLKASGLEASAFEDLTLPGHVLRDSLADFVIAGVSVGDKLVIDTGVNAGVYTIATVFDAQTLTMTVAWPAQPTLVDYRIVKETDWTTANKYRLYRDSTGNVLVFLNTDTDPIIAIDYNSISLPPSSTGIVKIVSNGLPAVVFGSFSPENLEQSLWDYVRYGITRHSSERQIVPPHQVLNQWNVMESPERLFTVVPHTLTSFKSSSTGITPQTDPDFLDNTSVPAFTQLNEGTPIVPLTQTYETRAPFPTQEFIAALNTPENVLNNSGSFTLNDGSVRYTLVVPDDVLYTSLKITETSEGETSLLAPADDCCGPQFGAFNYTNEVCLTYTGDALPEDESTGWVLNSDAPAEVSASVFGGILTYGTSGVGTKTVYLNNTPLPDAPSLETSVTFRIKLLSDATLGTADSQVRFGLSAPGMTLGIGFVTLVGSRYILIFDLNNGNIMGQYSFDYLDGNYHTYRIVRNPALGTVRVYIDS